ncbi:MAG: ABC transporter ATP-binding protein [Alphaproteobacteria bacterium]|nr:ABC transporter ATP-binding protein [Alphaproteobacteria bacterium]
MIVAKSLNKRFITDKGQVVDALRDVSFNVDAGEFYVLLGPSGSGKTTTLRAVAGIETADTGYFSIAGQTVFSSDEDLNIPPEERPVAMVFQSYALWPHMDVYNNIVFPLRKGVRRVAPEEIKRRVDAVVETLELTPYINRPISQLSGGQQQRVALARALALEPAVLLMDEPLSNLDAKLRTQLRVEIKNLTRKLGITTLYVTHDQVEAMVMGDRIAVMQNGEIAEEGSPADLYKHPVNEFVARFLGEMNFIPGALSKNGNGTHVVSTPLGNVPFANVPDRIVNDRVKLGFRPEDIQIGEQPDAAIFTAQIANRYYIGDAVLCDMKIGEHAFSARLPNTTDFNPGDEAIVSAKLTDFSIFPGGNAGI